MSIENSDTGGTTRPGYAPSRAGGCLLLGGAVLAGLIAAGGLLTVAGGLEISLVALVCAASGAGLLAAVRAPGSPRTIRAGLGTLAVGLVLLVCLAGVAFGSVGVPGDNTQVGLLLLVGCLLAFVASTTLLAVGCVQAGGITRIVGWLIGAGAGAVVGGTILELEPVSTVGWYAILVGVAGIGLTALVLGRTVVRAPGDPVRAPDDAPDSSGG